MAASSTVKNSSSITSFRELQGIWRSRGYGRILLIDDEEYELFEETAVSALQIDSGSVDELDEFYEDVEVSAGQNSFTARRVTGVTRAGFRRLQSLPATVTAAADPNKKNPQFNFDVFWHTFAEQYALFDLKGVDWQQMYQRFRPRITADSDPELLYATLATMLRPLRDGHVRLHTPLGHCSAGALPALYRRLVTEIDETGEHREVASYLSELREGLREVIHQDYLRGKVRSGCNRLVEWGRLNEQTGYLNLRAMSGQSGRVGHPAKDLDATHAVMQKVLRELGSLPNLVVDLRGNDGGYDGVALCFASYLIDRKRLAFTKSARDGNGFTGKQSVYVTPAAGGTYSGNLFILTSELTASAAEIFVLALLQHPRMTLIGEPTLGILSDALERQLPNGWHLTLSNEVYRAFDGDTYEDVGIPPHIRMTFLARKGRESGRDPMLDRVLKLVG